MSDLAPIGHNNPPDPIDQIGQQFESARLEAENWLDGTPVENENQMKAVDELRGHMRQFRLALERGQKAATEPLRAVYQSELDRWKPTITDAKRIEECLVAALDAFKRKLAADKEAARVAAQQAAWETTRAAQEAARQADASDINAQRQAAQAMADAEAAQAMAMAAQKDTVKGMRTVTLHEVTDGVALLNWIAANDTAAIQEFVNDWARKNHKARLGLKTNGLRVWTEMQAF